MRELGRSRSLREYRDHLRDTLGRLEAKLARVEDAYAQAADCDRPRLSCALDAVQDEITVLVDSLETIESELATRAAGSGHLPE